MNDCEENKKFPVVDASFLKAMDDIIERTRCNGSLMFTGTGGACKTFSSFWMARRIRDNPKHKTNEYRIVMVDPILKYRFNFDEIPFIDLSKARYFPLESDLILDMYHLSVEEKQLQYQKIILNEFNKAKDKAVLYDGVNPTTTFYFTDELHNILGRYDLVGKKGKAMKEVYTTGRNFGMIFIGITRSLAECSPTVVESCNTFLFGVTSGENSLNKIEAMTNTKVRNIVAGLKPRTFAYFERDTSKTFEIGFPEWIPVGHPKELNVENPNGYVVEL